MADIRQICRCEAAGRKYNEDSGEILQLDNNKGVLLIVCDGMGGMQAGEVASALALETIKKWFASERLTPQVMANPLEYLRQSIVGADINIKEYSKTHPETEGMGSTAVLAWLLGDKLYVAWCGDSRAYRYNPQLGLERLSHDHSMVQAWVDAGQITEEQAFDHPQSNIITRSLGDPNGEAMPDVAEYELYNNDVILLCSDGLCGTLRDREIEKILSENSNLTQCCNQLWQADRAAGWSDNVTTAMAQIVSGGAMLSMVQSGNAVPEEVEIMDSNSVQEKHSQNSFGFWKSAAVTILFLCGSIFAYLCLNPSPKPATQPTPPEVTGGTETGGGNSLGSSNGTLTPETFTKPPVQGSETTLSNQNKEGASSSNEGNKSVGDTAKTKGVQIQQKETESVKPKEETKRESSQPKKTEEQPKAQLQQDTNNSSSSATQSVTNQKKTENNSENKNVSSADKASHTAWYVFGNEKELKAHKILDKKNSVLTNSNFDKDYFTQVDTHAKKDIKLYSKSAKVLTNHPKDAYTLEKDGKGEYVLRINDAIKFWDTSKYLVIKVK